MSSMPEMPTMHPAKDKDQPFLWSQALYLIARLLSMLFGMLLISRVVLIIKYLLRGCLMLLVAHSGCLKIIDLSLLQRIT